MKFPLASGVAASLIVLDEVASTNEYLAARAGTAAGNVSATESATVALAEFTAVVTTNQTAGKGRLGRTWDAPAGTSLAASVLLHPQDAHLHRERYGWLPLVAGLAMSRAVSQLVPDREVTLKWPNDVLIGEKKVSGLLCELLPSGSVVVGAGVNLTIPADALPVPHATSLMLAGIIAPAEELADLVLAHYLRELRALWGQLTASDSAAGLHDIRSAVSTNCSTLGKRIRLALPDGTDDFATALDLDDAGQLRIRREEDGSVQAVAAGDITHLRYE